MYYQVIRMRIIINIIEWRRGKTSFILSIYMVCYESSVHAVGPIKSSTKACEAEMYSLKPNQQIYTPFEHISSTDIYCENNVVTTSIRNHDVETRCFASCSAGILSVTSTLPSFRLQRKRAHPPPRSPYR